MPVQTFCPFLSRRIARPATALAVAVAAAALTSCSASSDSSGAARTSITEQAPTPPTRTGDPSPTEVTDAEPSATVLQATEVDFAIELSERNLEEGGYTIEVTNEGDASHDMVVEDSAGTDVARTEILPPGESASVQVDLQPGEYVVYCSVGNHRGMGMELTVTVI